MGLLSLLKSVIGLDGSGSNRSGTNDPGRRDVDVTVEHEPAPENEAAVKGTSDAGDATPEAQPASPGGTEPVSDAGTGTTTGSTNVSETAETTESETDAEPEPTETTESQTDAGSGQTDEPAVDGADESVDTIKGIGPSYAERLGNIGIETVGELAAHDADEIAAETDLSEKRVGRWLDRARGEE